MVAQNPPQAGEVLPVTPTLTVTEAARVLGIGRNLAFELIRRNEFPTPALRLGARIVIPRQPLMRLLGLEGELSNSNAEPHEQELSP